MRRVARGSSPPKNSIIKQFTGVAIVMERGPNFTPGGQTSDGAGAADSGSEMALLYAVLVIFLVIPGLVTAHLLAGTRGRRRRDEGVAHATPEGMRDGGRGADAGPP